MTTGEVLVERYRHEDWGSRQEALRAVNTRLSELRGQHYVCEYRAGEYEEGGEVKPCEIVRAIFYPDATNVQPSE